MQKELRHQETKKGFAAMARKRHSPRLRIRETNEIEKKAQARKAKDKRVSADQFKQIEFMEIFRLKYSPNTSAPTDKVTQSQGQQTIADDSGDGSFELNDEFLGWEPSPFVPFKRMRGGKRKSFDLRQFDDMSTHLPKAEQITSETVPFGKHRSAYTFK